MESTGVTDHVPATAAPVAVMIHVETAIRAFLVQLIRAIVPMDPSVVWAPAISRSLIMWRSGSSTRRRSTRSTFATCRRSSISVGVAAWLEAANSGSAFEALALQNQQVAVGSNLRLLPHSTFDFSTELVRMKCCIQPAQNLKHQLVEQDGKSGTE